MKRPEKFEKYMYIIMRAISSSTLAELCRYHSINQTEMEQCREWFNRIVRIKKLPKEVTQIITKGEKEFLDVVNRGRESDRQFKYIAREADGEIFLFEKKPHKDIKGGFWIEGYTCTYIRKDYFSFVKWEDDEPWLIKDVLNLPVKEGLVWI